MFRGTIEVSCSNILHGGCTNMHQQWINHGLLVRLWDCTCTRNIKMWASHIQCTIFTHCQGLTPTRNKWTMMNNDEQWWNMMKHDGQGWTSYSKLPRNIEEICPLRWSRLFSFMLILWGQHDRAGALRSFCHSDHNLFLPLFLPQLAAMPDTRRNPAFS